MNAYDFNKFLLAYYPDIEISFQDVEILTKAFDKFLKKSYIGQPNMYKHVSQINAIKVSNRKDNPEYDKGYAPELYTQFKMFLNVITFEIMIEKFSKKDLLKN